MRLIVVVGVRANVVKVAPLFPALSAAGIDVQVAFAGSRGQALDCGEGYVRIFGMSIPEPTWYLGTSEADVVASTGISLRSFELLFAREHPDAVLVAGDVNNTVGAAISAAKAGLPVIHLEAGLRCGDLGKPDEINRVLISRLAAMHLTPTELAMENLEDEGIDPERIHFVGNTVAEQALREVEDSPDEQDALPVGVGDDYILATFHRQDHLGDAAWVEGVLGGLARSPLPILMPDGSAFAAAVSSAGLELPETVRIERAMPHLQMLTLIRRSVAVITDSGGVQEEACVLCAPCITVRSCTEHVATLANGANVLIEPCADDVAAALGGASTRRRTWAQPARWDRAVSDRVMRALRRGIIPLR